MNSKVILEVAPQCVGCPYLQDLAGAIEVMADVAESAGISADERAEASINAEHPVEKEFLEDSALFSGTHRLGALTLKQQAEENGRIVADSSSHCPGPTSDIVYKLSRGRFGKAACWSPHILGKNPQNL